MSDKTQPEQNKRAPKKPSAGNAADARVRFCLSPDGMKLGVSRYQPPGPGGRELTPEIVREQLAEAGVTLPAVPGAPERVVDLLSKGKNITKVVLVRGQDPREPAHGTIIPEGDLRFPVFAGDIIARKLPPSQGEPGTTIDGRELPPKSTTTEKMRDINAQAGENCSYDSAGHLFRAKVYGMGVIKDDTVHVVEGLSLSEDLTHILGVVHYRDHLGLEITPERFNDEIKRFETALPVNAEAVEEAVARAREERKLQRDVPVVQGREAGNGADGWLEYLVTTHGAEQKKPGLDATTEDAKPDSPQNEPLRIDYRERGALPTARAGETIARLHRPEPGVAGLDIYGRPIPAHSGKELVLKAGENVTAEADGYFSARAEGLVVVDGGKLNVTQLLVIPGDVDIGRGNVHAELGSVRVKGMVQTGMTVQAPMHIIVDDTVEGAKLKAGGDITVGGGLLMEGKGLVEAGSHVTASFANSANIKAGGDVTFTNNVTNCHIECGGVLSAVKGKGIVQGGEIVTPRGIEVNELGSDLGVATTVVINVHRNVDKDALVERRRLKRELDKIIQTIGEDDPRTILERTKPANRAKVAEVIKLGLGLRKQLELIDRKLEQESKRYQKALATARITVRRSMHPGVTIKLAGRVFKPERRIDASQIYWNAEERRIIVGRLGKSASKG